MEARRRSRSPATRTPTSTSRSGRTTGRSQTPYQFGWGYGADLGGLSNQPERQGRAITYPFKSYDGRSRFDRQITGERTFDYAKEGVANYGQYADWLADLDASAASSSRDDMWDGAEAYLEMWERAERHQDPGRAPTTGGKQARPAAGACARRGLDRRCSRAPASRSSARARGAGACR